MFVSPFLLLRRRHGKRIRLQPTKQEVQIMWTRSLLKSNAKQALQERYWRSVGLCLLLSLLGIGYSFPRLTAQYRVTSSQLNGMMSGPVWQGNAGGGYTSGNEEYLLQALAPFAGW